MALGAARAFADDIAIDLGTANTLVHVAGRGVVIDEPSAVAIRSRGGMREILAVGAAAKTLVGKTAEPLELLRPLRDGVIADFVATEEMLRQFIKRTKTLMKFRRPRILICVPAGATPVERRAVYDTALSAGASRVDLLEEPVAAAIGAGLPIDAPGGSMVVDIGGGTTDIAVLSLGRVVQARSLRIAGNAMDEAIIRHIRRKHSLLVGETNAERIKVEAGAAVSDAGGQETEIHIRGRDLRLGQPKSAVLGPADIAEALQPPIEEMAEFIQRALEELPPEVSTDVVERGIHMTGGGALLARLPEALEQRIGVRFVLPERPMLCVVEGTAAVLADLDRRAHLLVRP
jgi:rod shape-determining protein MreB